MGIKSNKLNRACLFHYVNQGDETITSNMCTLYGMFINAKYNGVIKDFTEQEIIDIAEKQHKAGKFSYTKGAYTADSNKAFLEYLDSKGIEYTCVSTKDDSEALEWAKRGYAVGIGIKVNSTFIKDKKDGSLDLSDYSKYKGGIGHFTNIIKWTSRGEKTDGEEYFLDSYFTKDSTYRCDIKKVLKEIDQPTKYIIY